MTADWAAEVPRLARLARLEVAPEEAVGLAAACEAITSEFAALAAFAAPLPEPDAARPAAPREDVVVAASSAEVEAILRAAPRVDASRAVVAPRGLP